MDMIIYMGSKKICNLDGLVKSLSPRHSRESGNPELVENTGFRIKSGMTNKANSDFLQIHQSWILFVFSPARVSNPEFLYLVI